MKHYGTAPTVFENTDLGGGGGDNPEIVTYPQIAVCPLYINRVAYKWSLFLAPPLIFVNC
jgi:hypothetical protein